MDHVETQQRFNEAYGELSDYLQLRDPDEMFSDYSEQFVETLQEILDIELEEIFNTLPGSVQDELDQVIADSFIASAESDSGPAFPVLLLQAVTEHQEAMDGFEGDAELEITPFAILDTTNQELLAAVPGTYMSVYDVVAISGDQVTLADAITTKNANITLTLPNWAKQLAVKDTVALRAITLNETVVAAPGILGLVPKTRQLILEGFERILKAALNEQPKPLRKNEKIIAGIHNELVEQLDELVSAFYIAQSVEACTRWNGAVEPVPTSPTRAEFDIPDAAEVLDKQADFVKEVGEFEIWDWYAGKPNEASWLTGARLYIEDGILFAEGDFEVAINKLQKRMLELFGSEAGTATNVGPFDPYELDGEEYDEEDEE